MVVAVCRDEHRRRELAEPAGRRGGRVVLPAARPHRAEVGGAEEGDHGLGEVRQEGAHAVALADAERVQVPGEGAGAVDQLGVGERGPLAGLRARDDGRRGRALRRLPGDDGGEVETGAREPARGRYPRPVLGGQDHGVVPRAERRPGHSVELEVLPHRAPERGRLVDGPAVQLVVVGHVTRVARARRGAAGEGGHARGLDPLGRRRPHRRRGAAHASPSISTALALMSTLRTFPVTVIGNSSTTCT